MSTSHSKASSAPKINSPQTRGDKTAAWAALQQYFEQHGKSFDTRAAFAGDSKRFEAFSQQAPYVFADLSKNRLDAKTQELLNDLAVQSGVQAHRDAMFAGEKINRAENRAVMHWLLRSPVDNHDTDNTELAASAVLAQKTLTEMLAYAEQIRADQAITDIVNIGIGGSDLGPQMAVRAMGGCGGFTAAGKRMHFVSNVDGHELATVLEGLQAKHTVFLISSKTFTSIDTMTNAHSAKVWFTSNYGDASAPQETEKAVTRHFVAMTTHAAAANAFGICTIFGFWDWVGGRYSMWSAIGLPIAIAIGTQGFKDMLAGAHAMDEHFRTEPLDNNLPIKLGLLDVWYRNFHGFTSRCVAPYHSALQRLPAYLQQLEMESNGKRVDIDGHELPFSTSAVVWGEPGTNGQHAFFQMLHQGTDVVPLEIIAIKHPCHSLPGHHQRLLANAVAQSQALMMGKASTGGHQDFPGNRPSTTLLIEALTPTSLGALIALYEHRVFVAGSIWGINCFDQWGVELGKVLALDIEERMASGNTSGLDGSTQGLLRKLIR